VAGWWIAVGALGLRLISSTLTLRHADLLQLYAKMGWSETQLQQMSANPVFRSGTMLWWSLAFAVLFLGYLIWIKRYFAVPTDSSSFGLETPPQAPSGSVA
jgi:hypothetical protein